MRCYFSIAKVLLLLTGISLFNQCTDEFLDVKPVDAVTPENFYQNEAQMQKALTGAYSALGNRGMYGWWLTLVRSLMSDDTETSEAQLIQFQQFAVTDTDRYLFDRSSRYGMWNSLYIGILRCNLIIAKISAENVPDLATRNKIVGQARFLRALYYFHVVAYWNRGAVLLEDNLDAIDVVVSPAERIWEVVETDLGEIIAGALLPWSYNGTDGNEIGRATLGSAYALLGKTYLYQKKYQEAADAFRQVINNGGYALLPVNEIWTVAGDNGAESVFEVQFNNAKAGPNPFFDDGVNAAETTLRNQTIAPNQYNGWENAWPSDDLVSQFEPGDLRRQAFIVLTGEPFPTRAEPFAGTPRNKGKYAIRKGMNSGFSTGTPDGTGEENHPVIRYADVLLMYAEALLNGGGDQIRAVDAIDQVRARAFGLEGPVTLRAAGLGIQDYASSKNLSLLEALKHERRLELCFEGSRYSDLLRWNDAQRNAILLDRGFSLETAYYPLSREDLDLSFLFTE